MIPNHSILKTPLRRSGLYDSFYNPHNLILKINYTSNKNNPFDGLMDFNATLIHEWIHWIQHHSTSFGMLLHALRYTQEEMTLTSLRQLPPNYSKYLIENRNKGLGSIIKINNNKFEQQNFGAYSNFINLFGQMWFDIQWIYHFLNNPNTVKTLGLPTGQIIGDSFSYIYLYNVFGNKRLSQAELFKIRQWYSFSDDELNASKDLRIFVKNKVQKKATLFSRIFNFDDPVNKLTSETLMECSATMSEIQFLCNNIDTPLNFLIKKEHFDSRIKLLMETSYGVPLKIFLNLTNQDINMFNVGSITTTLNTLIFIALNPPVPPLQYNPPKNKKTWSWFDIYPPIRFIRSVYALNNIKPLSAKAQNLETKEFINKICEISELPIINENSLKLNKKFQQIDFSDSSLNFDVNNPSFSSYDFIHWVQKEFQDMKEDSIHFLTNFSNCTVGDLSVDFLELLIPSDKISFAKVPMQWTKNDKIGFTSTKTAFYNILLRDLAFSNCLFDLVVGQKEFDLHTFTPQVNNSKPTHEWVKNSIYQSIVQTRNK
ncbi:MAG: hypothetical protein JNL70_26640 [Saprospiraceae bacterium]|nr:hypothetical protein [Saprospiraceae bacterium]